MLKIKQTINCKYRARFKNFVAAEICVQIMFLLDISFSSFISVTIIVNNVFVLRAILASTIYSYQKLSFLHWSLEKKFPENIKRSNSMNSFKHKHYFKELTKQYNLSFLR